MRDKTNLRKTRIKTFLTDDEYKTFLSDCDLFGMSQSELIRWSLFNKEIIFKVRQTNSASDEQIKDYLVSLSKIGTNLNQIAKYCNEGGTLTTSILQEIHKLNTQILKINTEISEQKITRSETKETIYELK